MGLANPKPRKCLNTKPSTKSILFCGEFIHLPTLHMACGLSISYLSLIFARKRDPTLQAAERMAIAMNMGLEEFLMGLRGHVRHYKSSGRKPFKHLKNNPQPPEIVLDSQ